MSLSAGEEVNESKIKGRSQCDGREEEDGGGEEEAESKEKKTSCSQEHLLAQRKESNYNLTKSPSTGLTKYLTGSWHFPKYRIFLFLPFFRQLRKAGVESNTDGLCSSPKPNPNVFLHKKVRKCLSFQVGLVVLTFLICWLPFFVLALVIPLVGRVPGAVQTTLHLQLGCSLHNSLVCTKCKLKTQKCGRQDRILTEGLLMIFDGYKLYW